VKLPWSEVDPQTHECDLDLVRPFIESVVMAQAATFRNNPNRDAIVYAIATELEKLLGPWAFGWNWNPGEGGNGGPTIGWCCTSHSVFPKKDKQPIETAQRAMTAIAGWRGYLERLSREFATIRIATAELPLEVEVERAAARLLPLVVECTFTEDAWYNTMTAALTWYLEARGIEDPSALAVVASVIDGRYESWVEPDAATANQVSALIGAGVAEHVEEAPIRDSLVDWLIARDRRIELPPREYPLATGDEHELYIEIIDRERDPQRANRMAAALIVCRDAAARDDRLTFDMLAEWQRIVLGADAPVPLRTTDAFAKQGRECYGTPRDLAEQFDRVLATANDAQPVAVRAARAYLDVCFFHPFADGNARAARLAMDFVLTAARFRLVESESVFKLSRGADDPDGVWNLARVVDRSIGARDSTR
jgi:hypothetical protein